MEYKLLRSKRKSLTICIVRGEIIVKSPQKTTVEHIEAFLAQKEQWIAKKLAEQTDRNVIFSDVINGTKVLYHGVLFAVQKSDKHKRVAIDGNSLLVPVKYEDGAETMRAVTAWYKRLAAKELCAALDEMSQRTRLSYSTFALTNAKSKWGSCDGKNNIRLNWRLLMLDKELVDYVIIHELAHTVHHNHSAAFWAEVQKHINCAPAKKWLKAFAILTTLYR